MTTTKFKVESGIQLLARLTRKPEIENFYPVLFQNGPKPSEVIELYSDSNNSCLLTDIISEALTPTRFGGAEAGVLIFNTDGHLNFESLLSSLRKKLLTLVPCNSSKEFNNYLQEALCNCYLLEIFDATQFYTTIHNLESILVEHSNISLIVFNSLTAFYWSEQGLKISKMDAYVKSLLRMIQKITMEYKIAILYTRPEYFSSSKDNFEKLEVCCEQPTLERVNYRIQVLSNEDGAFQVNVKTSKNSYKKFFNFIDEFKWL